jgi:hypothetical protein
MRPSDLSGAARDAYDMWHGFFGLSEQAALRCLQEDGQLPTSDNDRVVHMFREAFDLSESAARVAVAGRGVSLVSEVRQSGDAFEARLRWAQEALDSMSDREIDQMFVEEQQWRKRKKTATPAASGKSVRRVVNEHNAGR